MSCQVSHDTREVCRVTCTCEPGFETDDEDDGMFCGAISSGSNTTLSENSGDTCEHANRVFKAGIAMICLGALLGAWSVWVLCLRPEVMDDSHRPEDGHFNPPNVL